ncbi:hypothetical protein F4809DRAFT_602464 [Biscogniauxia mediterranea]|nr:hypothetical protein F4809DRAFT_602464 [Biscogniauxia mediterranea]
MMQDLQRHKDVVFESQKLNFALGVVDPGEAQPSQPWLEVAAEQDEKGTPGLQVVPQEHQKYMDHRESKWFPYFQWAIPVPNQYYVQSAQESSLEVVPQTSLHDVQQFGVWNSETHPLQAPPPLNFDPSWAKDEAHMIAAAKTKGKRRKRWVIGGIIVVVIIGVVLGAVLGTTARRSSGSGKTTSNESSPTTIKDHSKIAVTGYRLDSGDGDDYAIRIFFQDPQDQLCFVSKESTSDNWTDSMILDTLPYAPKKDGAIAASSYMNSGTKPILELFYEDEDSMVRGHMFNFALENGTLPLKGQSSSLNDYLREMAAGTRISSFFPYVATQDADNKVRWTVMYGMNGSNPASPWWVNDTDLGIEASTGSGLVSLPAAQDYTDASGVVYRSTDGKLSCKLRNASAE